MLCERCHKKVATVRYAEVVDGQVSERHLCPECLAIQQKNAAQGFEFKGPSVLHRRPSPEKVIHEAVKVKRACPHCGARLSQILEQGEVGCRVCYEAFEQQIESLLGNLQQATRHTGKTMIINDDRARMQAVLQEKRVLLRSVLRAEQYEEAAALRDEIRTLETELSPAPVE
ncbi:MAG: hypothetical protein HYV27_02245 [Candidatus Hydrogenedentes bacterium]|nr:hypothetical protein [Candidatus Hydrogenedentota bacterium]